MKYNKKMVLVSNERLEELKLKESKCDINLKSDSKGDSVKTSEVGVQSDLESFVNTLPDLPDPPEDFVSDYLEDLKGEDSGGGGGGGGGGRKEKKKKKKLNDNRKGYKLNGVNKRKKGGKWISLLQ